ncbi:response regulator transcription factor [Corynebacterium riegelii]|uniref:response regulator transcription factor n=1 Tax=Corynebacterium riegelii TaxID=156976 RepID=UPI00288B7016|nr:response regulator transcription factor [Corynebacterium riegelii]
MATRVFLIDDDPTILEAFHVYLSATDDLAVVGTATTGQQALQWLETNSSDLVLCDVHIPDTDGIELLQHTQQFPQPPLFVAMTAFDTDETMLKCLSLGAVGYIIKGQTPESIIHSLRDAIHGGTALSTDCLSRLVRIKTDNGSQSELHAPRITGREQDVLSLICKGKTNEEIGESMHLAEVTIRKIVSQLFLRFSARNRVELAVKYHSIKDSYQ